MQFPDDIEDILSEHSDSDLHSNASVTDADIDYDSSSTQEDSSTGDESHVYEQKRHEKLLLVVAFMTKHNLKGDIVSDLLQLINTYVYLETGNEVTVLKSGEVKKFLQNVRYPIEKQFYCPKCSGQLDDTNVVQCAMCNNAITPEISRDFFFLQMSVTAQLESLLMQSDLYESVSMSYTPNTAWLGDIKDGALYKKLSANFQVNEDTISLTLTMNTDGVRVFRSNHFDIWPVYLCINELPQHVRYLPKNLLLAALWKGSKKPTMLTFLKPLFSELKQLEIGSEILTCLGRKKVKASLLCTTFDLPARAMVLNMTQYNGASSCHRCLHPGERFKVPGKRGPGTNTFPYRKFGFRSDRSIKEAGKQAAESGIIQDGVKGPSILSYVSHYSFTKGCAIDIMHGGFLGLAKQKLELLFGEKNKNEPFSCFREVALFDERLASIMPPRSVKRMPRPTKEIKHYKAAEFAMIVIMYVPAFLGLLPDHIMRHLCHLSNALYRLYKPTVTDEDLQSAEYSIHRYCEQFADIFGPQCQTSNFHNIQHIVEDVRNLGPLWNTDCFPYENASGELMKHIFGTQSADYQFIRAVSTIHKLPHIVRDIDNDLVRSFVGKMLDHKWASKELEVDDNIVIMGKLSTNVSFIETRQIESAVRELFNDPPLLKCVLKGSFSRFRCKSRVYHCRCYTKATKRNSYTIIYKDENGREKYGMIETGYLTEINTGIGPDRQLAVARTRSLEILSEGIGAAGHCCTVAPPNFEQECDKVIPLKNILNMCVFLQFPDVPNQCFVSRIPHVTHVV